MKHHTRMEMMIWLLMTLKWFQRKLLIWIPWWNSVWKILRRHRDFEGPEEQINLLAEDRNDDDIIDENTQETVEADSLNQNDLEDVIIELDNLYQKRQAQFQDTFLTKIFRKVTADIKDNQKRNEALGLLVDVAGDYLNDKRFMQFLSENVGYKYKSQSCKYLE